MRFVFALHDVNISLVVIVVVFFADSSIPKISLGTNFVVVRASVAAKVTLIDCKVSMARTSLLISLSYRHGRMGSMVENSSSVLQDFE